jgi:hypothetical protein
MAAATTQAQELITCDLNCVKPVQQYCNSCQIGLCADCINKHVNSLKSMKHDIVPFTKCTVQLVFPQCTSHSHQRCEAHCQKCDIPVCIKCLLGSHKGHDVVDIADVIAKMKENIKRETEVIESSLITKNKSSDADVEKKISKSKARYSDFEKEAKDKRKIWHIEIDNIFDNLESLIQSFKDQEITILKSCQSKLRSQNSSMIQTVQENKKILKSNNVSDINNYRSKLTEFRAIPQVPDVMSPSLNTNSVQGREFSLELGDYRATLTQIALSLPSLTDEVLYSSGQELIKKAKVIAKIRTNVKQLHRVVCVGSDRAWISGIDRVIHSVDIHGTVQATVTSTCKNYPDDITVNRQGELIYSDGSNRTIDVVRHGKTENLITAPQGWHPWGLCCTRSGDILVSMVTTANESHQKIVRYQGQNVTQEIDKDDRGNPIYQGGKYTMYVTENNNGDVVVSDPNANTVVVVESAGKVRFRYNDKPPGGKKPFCSRQIVTDSMGHIIVADSDNSCLHILGQNGQFIKCVDNCGLNDRPCGLSVDNEGRLWVGQSVSGKVKVIQYIK